MDEFVQTRPSLAILRPTIQYQPSQHQPSQHQPARHQSTRHQPTRHQSTRHQPGHSHNHAPCRWPHPWLCHAGRSPPSALPKPPRAIVPYHLCFGDFVDLPSSPTPSHSGPLNHAPTIPSPSRCRDLARHRHRAPDPAGPIPQTPPTATDRNRTAHRPPPPRYSTIASAPKAPQAGCPAE